MNADTSIDKRVETILIAVYSRDMTMLIRKIKKNVVALERKQDSQIIWTRESRSVRRMANIATKAKERLRIEPTRLLNRNR